MLFCRLYGIQKIFFRQGKVIIAAIRQFKMMLSEIEEYHHYPLPKMCKQATSVTCWFYLFMGVFANQPCDHCVTEYDTGIYMCRGLEEGHITPEGGDFWWLLDVSIL